MQGSVTGIDISDDRLTAVQLIKGMGGWEITACAQAPLNGEDPFDEGLSVLAESMNLDGGECILALPGAETYYRNLTVPFKDRRKQREILSFELEPNIPFPIDTLIVDFLSVNRTDRPEVLAFFVEKEVVRQRLHILQKHNLDPEAICVRLMPLVLWLLKDPETPQNGVFLELGEKRITLILWQEKRVVFIRTFVYEKTTDEVPDENSSPAHSPEALRTAMNAVRHTVFAFGAEQPAFAPPQKTFLTGEGARRSNIIEMVSQTLETDALQVDLLSDKRIRPGETVQGAWDGPVMTGALSLALGWYGAGGLGPDFRKDEFAIQKQSVLRSPLFRKVAVWLAVIAALWGADMGVDIYFLKQRAAALDARILSLFKKTFPHVTRIVDPLKQAQIEVNQLERTSTPGKMAGIDTKALDLLLEISERLPETIDLKVSRLIIDPGSVRIKGHTDTYNTVDQVKQGLEKSSLFKTTTISSANLDRGTSRVLFEVKLER